MHIYFRNFKSIIGFYHCFDAFSRFGRKFISRHQNTIALFCATSYSTSQLMKLRQAKTFGTFYNHYRSIWYIYAHFNYCCSYHYFCFSTGEILHRSIFIIRFHFTMKHRNLIIWNGKNLCNMFETFHQIFIIQRFRFFD